LMKILYNIYFVRTLLRPEGMLFTENSWSMLQCTPNGASAWPYAYRPFILPVRQRVAESIKQYHMLAHEIMHCTGVTSFFHLYHKNILVYWKICLNHSYSPKFVLASVILIFGFLPTFKRDKCMQLTVPLPCLSLSSGSTLLPPWQWHPSQKIIFDQMDCSPRTTLTGGVSVEAMHLQFS
jgi:hypothetical protein